MLIIVVIIIVIIIIIIWLLGYGYGQNKEGIPCSSHQKFAGIYGEVLIHLSFTAGPQMYDPGPRFTHPNVEVFIRKKQLAELKT